MELKDIWIDQRDDVDMAGADVINEIANAVIQIEKNKTTSISENPSDTKYPTEKAVADYVSKQGGGGGGAVDTEMSDSSTNAVQNKVIKKYVDENVGDIEIALDNIIAIQNSLIGGEGA